LSMLAHAIDEQRFQNKSAAGSYHQAIDKAWLD